MNADRLIDQSNSRTDLGQVENKFIPEQRFVLKTHARECRRDIETYLTGERQSACRYYEEMPK